MKLITIGTNNTNMLVDIAPCNTLISNSASPY